MERHRMVRKLKDLICRSYEGKRNLKVMDVEALKEALERLDEEVPERQSPKIGFDP